MKFKNTPMISTERLSLQSFRDCDREDMIALFKNEEIGKTFMVPSFKSYEEEVKMFERMKKLSESDEYFVYGIYFNDTLIGIINVVDSSEQEVEIGYVIHPSYKSKGFATEAVKAAMQELFDSGFTVVKAGAFEGNAASFRVMEKSGMTRIAYEDDVEYRGELHHCIYYAKEKESKNVLGEQNG